MATDWYGNFTLQSLLQAASQLRGFVGQLQVSFALRLWGRVVRRQSWIFHSILYNTVAMTLVRGRINIRSVIYAGMGMLEII